MFLIKQQQLLQPPTNNRFVTDKRLRTVNFTADNIENIQTSLNSNKTHGHDNISISMLKTYVVIHLSF